MRSVVTTIPHTTTRSATHSLARVEADTLVTLRNLS
jgi:hypothetical protein